MNKDDETQDGRKPQARRLALVPVAKGEGAVGRKRPADGGVMHDGGTTLIAAKPYMFGSHTVRVGAVYYVEREKGRDEGPWLGEADKIAWRDPATGYECIILRSGQGGHLCGYVGLPPRHPLYGFDHEAVSEALDIDVHGGLSYSRICDAGPPPERDLAEEARRICHVPRSDVPIRPTNHANDYRVERDDAWWFGFECNHVYDLLPDVRSDHRPFLGLEVGATYRDEAYVYGEVVHLAAQLRAIADGEPTPARTGAPPPPIGLDPKWNS